VFSANYVHCHSEVFSDSYAQCHSQVFNALYGHCHSAPYRRSAVVMNIPVPRTASCQNDAAACHSCQFNTVLYPRSSSECQLPLNCSHHYIPGAALLLPQSRIIAVLSQSQHYLHWHLCRPVNIYIYIYIYIYNAI